MAEPSLAAADAEVDQCSSSSERMTSEHHYTVAARVRPLLFWISRDDVGDARIAQSEVREGTSRLELLIGSDPERAPMRINRWGYLAESFCGGVAELVGVMTESDEETIEDARKRTGQAASEHRFKVIRSSVADGEVTTSLFRLALSEGFTYRDVASLLARLPPRAATVKRAPLPAGIDTGFLVAMTGLLHETVHAYHHSGQARHGLRRVFVHDGRLYDLTQRSARVHPEFRLRDKTYPRAIEGEFELRSRVTGKTKASESCTARRLLRLLCRFTSCIDRAGGSKPSCSCTRRANTHECWGAG
jgi:hypothetical protein